MEATHSTPSRNRSTFVSPSQIIALGLVAASIGWAVWLLRDRPSSEETELLSGSVLPSSELAIMEAAFDRAQLTDYRTESGRLYVPRSRHSAFMRALVDAEALPREFGGSLRRALANNSPWQSKAVQVELLRVATQDELSLVLCSMPGIERAAVLYDVEARTGLEGGTVKTASISIRTAPDTELDPMRVQAIRVLVAASIAGLSAERVAVTDLRSGRVFAGPLEDPAAALAADPGLARTLAYERALATKLRQSLSFIKGAIIDVTVQFVPTPSAPTPLASVVAAAPAPPHPLRKNHTVAAANAPAEIELQSQPLTAPEPAPLAPPAPEPVAAAPVEQSRLARGDMLASLHVSIAVPDTYFQAAIEATILRETNGSNAAVIAPTRADVEAGEIQRIQDLVAQMIPPTADPESRRIVVARFPVVGSSPVAVLESLSRGRAPSTPLADPSSQSRTAGSESSLPAKVGELSLAGFLADASTTVAGWHSSRDVPREVWLAATSVGVGLLAGFLWWAGARGRGHSYAEPSVRPVSRRGLQQAGHPAIDWSSVLAAAEDSLYHDEEATRSPEYSQADTHASLSSTDRRAAA